MAQERGYERQVGPAQPVALPNASPGAFGAGVGAGIADLGQTLHQVELRAYQVERQVTADQENADAAAKIAEARLALERQRAEARSAPAAGAAGHADAMTAAFDTATKGIGDTITDDRVRRSVTAQIGEMRAGFVGSEVAWQTGMGAKKVASDLGVTADRYSALVASNPQASAEATMAWDDAVDAQQNIGEDVREAVRREGHAKLATAYGQRMMDDQPNALLQAIDKGAFNDVLDGDALDRLRNGAQARVKRAEAEARALAAAGKAVEKDELGAVEVTLRAGGGTYADRVAVANRYAAIGDNSKAEEWRGEAASFQTVQGTKNWKPAEIDTRMAALDAKRGGAGLSAAEAHEYNGLKSQRTIVQSNLSQPGGALVQMQYATGKPIPPLDPGDAASLRTRGTYARAAAAEYGTAVQPILATELPAFRDLYEQGGKGRAQVLAAVKGFGTPASIMGAVRQVAGDADEGDFRVAATLPDAAARTVLRGKDALKARPDLIDDKDARWVVDTYYGPVLRYLPADQQADLFQAARSYFAAKALGGGEQGWDAKKATTRNRSRGLFAGAIEAVMGKVGDRGGVKRTDRGLIIVPPDMTGEQMERAFARADADDYARASGAQVPYWSDGARAMNRRELVATLPTLLRGSTYGFRNRDGGLVLRKDGEPYTVDIRKLAQR